MTWPDIAGSADQRSNHRRRTVPVPVFRVWGLILNPKYITLTYQHKNTEERPRASCTSDHPRSKLLRQPRNISWSSIKKIKHGVTAIPPNTYRKGRNYSRSFQRCSSRWETSNESAGVSGRGHGCAEKQAGRGEPPHHSSARGDPDASRTGTVLISRTSRSGYRGDVVT